MAITSFHYIRIPAHSVFKSACTKANWASTSLSLHTEDGLWIDRQGTDSTNVGNNTVGGLNLVFAAGNNINVGNNTGGGLNIAVELLGATDVGNCASAVCVNLFGIQLVGP